MSEKKKFSWPGWKTVRLIGRDRFGAIYRIQKKSFGKMKKAALKVITIPQSDNQTQALYRNGFTKKQIASVYRECMEHIVAECSTMRNMRGCRHIVSCDDVRCVRHKDGIGWDILIKMELLTPLRKTLSEDTPEETVINAARDICLALNECQAHGVTHRNIHPQNIYVSRYGDCKLGDFGQAKAVEKTMGGAAIDYMAPEIYHEQPYGEEADVYSLGLVMYWMLNERRLPFEPILPEQSGQKTNADALRRRLSGDQIPEPAHGSEKLRKIVMKACSYDPKDRYHSVEELLQALNQLDVLIPLAYEDEMQVKQEHKHADSTSAAGSRAVQRKKPGKAKSRKAPLMVSFAAVVIALIVILLLVLRESGPSLPIGTEPGGSVASTAAPLETIPDGTEDGPEETVAQVYEPVLNTNCLSLFPGDNALLTVSGVPEDAKIKWKSSKKSVAKVSDEGEVTAVGEGVTTITATVKHDGKTWKISAEVTVVTSGITLSEYTIRDFYIGQTRTLTATTSPAGEKVQWQSSNNSVVTVSDQGVLTAVGAGTAQITASFGSYSETCTVTVDTPSLSLSVSSMNLVPGATANLTATTNPSNLSVSWSSSDTSVATVRNGKVTGVAPGSATITAQVTCAGKTYTATCRVTVTDIGITVTSSASSLSFAEKDKQTCTVTAQVKPAGGTVTWQSSNSSVATVSGSGATATVTPVSAGTTTITATYSVGGVTVSDSCTITVTQLPSTLALKGLWCTPSGSLDSIQVGGTISSNYALTRMEVSGTGTAIALDVSMSKTADPYIFPAGTYTFNMADGVGYIVGQFRSLFNTYKSVAQMAGVDNSVSVVISGTVYDSSGNSASFTLNCVIAEN